MTARVPVRCWVCGWRGLRTPKGRRVPVVGRQCTVQPHGACPACRKRTGAEEALLTDRAARLVLRAAIEWDNAGMNG